MSFKMWLLVAAVVLGLVANMVYKVDKVFVTMAEQAEAIKQISKERDDLKAANTDLKSQIERYRADELEKAAINATLRDEVAKSEQSFKDLMEELNNLRRGDRTKPVTTTTVPKPTQPAEVDIAWKAYCKAMPGGCPQGAMP